MMTKERLLGICFLFATIIAVVVHAGKDNDLSESMMSGVNVRENLLPWEKPANESDQLLFTLENHGILERGLANLNLMQSVELKEAFKRINDRTASKNTCKTFRNPFPVLYKFCGVNTSEVPDGTYSSTIKITKSIRYSNRQRVISYILYVTMSVQISGDGKYERCPIKDPSQIEPKYSQHQTIDVIKYEVKEEKKEKVFKIYEFMMPSVEYLTVVYITQPQFFRVIVTEPPSPDDKTDECHFFEQQHDRRDFDVIPQKCNFAGNQQHTIKKDMDESVTLKFEEEKDKFSMLLYDSAVKEDQLENIQEKDKDPRYLQLVGLSKKSMPNRVSFDNMSTGKMFSFSFHDNTTKNRSDRSEFPSGHGLVVFFAANKSDDSKAKNNFKKKVELPQPKKSREVRKEVLNWMMTSNNFSISTDKEYTKIPTVCTKKQLTCGIVAMEMARNKMLPLSLFDKHRVFTMFLKTKIAMSQDGKELSPKDKNEVKFRQRKLPIKNKPYGYDVLLEMNPVFMGRVRKMIRFLKRSISSKFGRKVWKTFAYSSELTITRHLVCSNQACKATIRAMLEYNVTRKALRKPFKTSEPNRTGLGRIFAEHKQQNKQQKKQQQQQQLQQQQHQQDKQQKQQHHQEQQQQQQQQQKQPQQQQQQKNPSSREPMEKIKDIPSKLFFQPAANKGDEKAENDALLKENRINSRQFKVAKAHLADEDKSTNRLVQVLADSIKKYGDDLERFTKERMKALKESEDELKSSCSKFSANTFMCIAVVLMNAWLLFKE